MAKRGSGVERAATTETETNPETNPNPNPNTRAGSSTDWTIEPAAAPGVEAIANPVLAPAPIADSEANPDSAAAVLARRLRPIAGRRPGSLMIHEIYRSLQGESTFAGLPCVFVRLTGCHLRCRYCDTPHAFARGREMTPDQVLAEVLALAAPGDLVEITGGEPLLQPECLPLVSALADAGRVVLVETSGSVDVSPVDPRARIVMDWKTPGSGEADANHEPNLERLRPRDELKFVVTNRDDWEWAGNLIRTRRLAERCEILVSPAFGAVEPAELAAWILESGLRVRFQTQLHKAIWGPDRRGV